MPVVLPRDAWPVWLGEHELADDEVLGLLRPYAADLMRAFTVGTRVGNVRNNDPTLLDPVTLAA
jgi:putative SOS response-associated peptidase YedK